MEPLTLKNMSPNIENTWSWFESPNILQKLVYVKGFGSTLIGSTLKWLLNVPPYSVNFFTHLVNFFNNLFSCSKNFEKLISDLNRVTQGNDESLRHYVCRFGKKVLDIRHLDVATAIETCMMGLKKDYPFYKDLVMTP